MLEMLFAGEADVDALTVALAALFRHHYDAALDDLVAFVRDHPRYTLVLFLASLARHKSVEEYVCGQSVQKRKVAAFLPPLREAVERLLDNAIALEVFERAAFVAWILA
tara:strand:+ start:743 stop:1069 length:327 start_codon:yes stop_codon:yes gene_type:complete